MGEGIKALRDAISGVFTVDALRERLAFATDLVEASEKEKVKLEEELAQAKEEIRQLHAHLEAKAKASAKEFEEEAGALFKRNPRGGFFEAVYCPACKTSCAWEGGFDKYLCARCGWGALFSRYDLPDILARLNALG